jgi:AcrR family transcriptional regulator
MSKNERPLDPRVRRTRKLLLDALMELIPEKGYNAITIQDITDRATLNRATFYLHYRDKDDLLYQGIHETLDNLHSRQPVPVLEQDRLTMNESVTTILSDFEHIGQNADFYCAMLGESGTAEFALKLKDLVLKTTERRLMSALGELPSGPLATDLVLEFMASGYIGVIRWWLENDMPYTPEVIARQLIHMYAVGCYKALGMEADMGEAS